MLRGLPCAFFIGRRVTPLAPRASQLSSSGHRLTQRSAQPSQRASQLKRPPADLALGATLAARLAAQAAGG
eukprot:9600095-Alexandrium_andersonii.AAC.1